MGLTNVIKSGIARAFTALGDLVQDVTFEKFDPTASTYVDGVPTDAVESIAARAVLTSFSEHELRNDPDLHPADQKVIVYGLTLDDPRTLGDVLVAANGTRYRFALMRVDPTRTIVVGVARPTA